MEKVKRRRITSNRGFEENTLAILEAYNSHDTSHVHDDRLAFLDAVRSASIVAENGTPPTNKMMEAIFGIMREEKSLELIIASYRLLCELEKRYPRVYLSNWDREQGLPGKDVDLVVMEESWSPFAVGADVGSSDKRGTDRRSKEPIDVSDFHVLLAGLTDVATETDSSERKLELLANMFLFQYLVSILGADFLPRHQAFLGISNWNSLRESFLNKLLGSRRINYKAFIKDCIYVLSDLSTQTYSDFKPAESTSSEVSDSGDLSLALSLPEAQKGACKAVRELLKMLMELDSSKKKADMQGLTTRLDGVRTPVIELTVDELSYNKGIISSFFQGFDESKLKLEIVSQYLQKYTAKPSTRNRRANGSHEEGAIAGVFECFLNISSTKGIIKKIGAEAVQVLLAHALQACMSIPKEERSEEISDLKEDAESQSLFNICEKTISAFTRLREADERLQILPIGKEALFTAATILSTSS